MTDSPQLRQLMWVPGGQVNNYRLVGEIARGGMAEIWLARQQAAGGIERPVVVKRILASSEEDPAFVHMFLDEARIAAQLNHPNIVQVFEFAELAGSYFLVMEYLAGESVSQVVRKLGKAGQRVTPDVAATVVAQAAAGLGYAHLKKGQDGLPMNIVHRDVSPQNLLVTYEGQVKVLDFGIAHATGRMSHTRAGMMKGKLAYMAPEQTRSSSVDARADVFSLGVVLFEMITGERLYGKSEDVTILQKLTSEEPLPTPSMVLAGVPPGLDGIVARALSKDRELRQSNGVILQQELETWLRAEGRPPANLAPLMAEHFAARIAEREKLLTSPMPEARKEEGSSPGSREVSMPGKTPTSSRPKPKTRTRSQPKPKSNRALLVGILVALVAAVALITVALLKLTAAAPTKLTVTTVPATAKIRIDGFDCASPCATEVAEGTHVLDAKAEGYVPDRREVTVDRGGARDVVIMLARVQAAAPEVDAGAPVAEVKPAEPGKTEPGKTEPGKEPGKTEPGKVPKVAEAARGKGRLSLETNPWTKVYLGKTALGETPILEVPVPSGKLRLRLVNEESKIDTVIEVQVEAGKTTVKKLEL